MSERGQYQGLIDGARREGILLCRIADAAYTGKKPFDMFGVLPNGRALAVEVKRKATMPFSPWSLLEPHQLNWLKAYAANGGEAILAVHVEDRNEILLWRAKPDGELWPVDGRLVKDREDWRGLAKALGF